MSIRLLVSDVDGTLVDKHKQLTPATIAAVPSATCRVSGSPRKAIAVNRANTAAVDDSEPATVGPIRRIDSNSSRVTAVGKNRPITR